MGSAREPWRAGHREKAERAQRADPSNAEHELHRSKHGWHQLFINRLIKNPRYVGKGIYAGAETTAYPALVDEVTFQAAQKGFARWQSARPSLPQSSALVFRR